MPRDIPLDERIQVNALGILRRYVSPIRVQELDHLHRGPFITASLFEFFLGTVARASKPRQCLCSRRLGFIAVIGILVFAMDVLECHPSRDYFGLDVRDGCRAGPFDTDGVEVDPKVKSQNGDFI